MLELFYFSYNVVIGFAGSSRTINHHDNRNKRGSSTIFEEFRCKSL